MNEQKTEYHNISVETAILAYIASRLCDSN